MYCKVLLLAVSLLLCSYEVKAKLKEGDCEGKLVVVHR